MNYSQCVLHKGYSAQVSWIPQKFASVGNVIRLRNDSGVWSDGWVVVEVWQTVPEEQLPDSHLERKAHKRATGDVS